MRDILFRGKTLDGRWVVGLIVKDFEFYGQKDEHTYIVTHQHPSGCFGGDIYIEVIPEAVGQYTGLTDVNGTKIFEGDIIKSCEYDDIYFIKYCADDNYPAFDVVPEMNIECNGLSHLHIVEGIEVIGNIHDNPELLKGGE